MMTVRYEKHVRTPDGQDARCIGIFDTPDLDWTKRKASLSPCGYCHWARRVMHMLWSSFEACARSLIMVIPISLHDVP